MRKIVLSAAIAAMAGAALAAPSAKAQGNYPNVRNLTPFTAECGYMSKPGYLRYRNFVATGEWIDYETAARIVADQGG